MKDDGLALPVFLLAIYLMILAALLVFVILIKR
jgi:hypothetical protein